MEQAYFEQDVLADKRISDAEASDEEDLDGAVTKKRIAPGPLPENDRKDIRPIIRMPKAYNSAKKCLMAQLDNYFKEMKDQYTRLKEQAATIGKQQPTIVVRYVVTQYQEIYISDVMRALRNTIRLSQCKKPVQIAIESVENKQPLCIYVPERNTLAIYSAVGGMERRTKIRDDGLKLPDVATPILHEGWAYLLDGSLYSQDRRVFVPCSQPIRIGIDSGTTQTLPAARFSRMKCGIVSDGTFAYALGGMVTDQKIMTSTCQRFKYSSLTWEKIGSLCRPHICASACLFKGDIFLFSKQGIQRLDKSSLQWSNVPTPFGMMIPSYSFSLQISTSEIAILGGWSDTARLQSVDIFNVVEGTSTCLEHMLPSSICQQRVSSPTVHGNKLLLVSPLHGQVAPQVALKKGIYQVILCWSNIAQVKQIITI